MIIATKNESRSRSAHKLGSAHQRTRELRDSIEEDMAHFIHNGGADFDGFLESFPVYSGQFSDESNAERFHELKWDLRKC